MIESLTYWWNARAPRERVLLAIMGVLLAGMVLWLGVYRPVEEALENAAIANAEASQLYADVARKVELVKAGKGGAKASGLPVEQIVGQSAGEAGFTLERVQALGGDRVEVALASARMTALMSWVAALEAQGVIVEKAMISPSGATGTVSAQITYKRAGV